MYPIEVVNAGGEITFFEFAGADKDDVISADPRVASIGLVARIA